MAIYINDVKIENDAYGHGRFRIEYKDKAVVVERYHFNHLYDTLDHRQMYNFIVREFFNEKPDMMYDEYFGTDSYDVDRETERLKKLKIEQFERGIRGEKGKEQKPTPKQVNDRKRTSTFWGMLIQQDIIDGIS
ncbi:hypothetical protein FDG95_gp189 [Pectobacterium phage vB_PcaM_CBB]|uniref:Uncharacterized protein n=1 Tax=Pectobacterium phage vB_PcaM_CBB TaxID=2772511 RepID=A0A1L2CUR2_9CAUD|nr:hypothetical protein FDG95_gp189 [Pectobacterium phage vB_PcaM_CBB]AMM43754.1 hypothetical protein CBB_189 [Pectobacterium phage vB_PcaM_CBB]